MEDRQEVDIREPENIVCTKTKGFVCEVCHIHCPSLEVLCNHQKVHKTCRVQNTNCKSNPELSTHTKFKEKLTNKSAMKMFRMKNTSDKSGLESSSSINLTTNNFLKLTKSEVKRVLGIQEPLPSLACIFCQKTFKEKQELVRHKCDVCAQYYKAMKPIPQSKPSYKCWSCRMTFKTKEEQTEHSCKMRRKKALPIIQNPNPTPIDNPIPCVCDICGKSFKYKEELFAHKLKHAKETSLRCRPCFQEFQNREVFHLHFQKFHSGEVLHLCDYCEMRFETEETLKEHKLVHCKVESLRCPQCNDTATMQNLRMHSLSQSCDKHMHNDV